MIVFSRLLDCNFSRLPGKIKDVVMKMGLITVDPNATFSTILKNIGLDIGKSKEPAQRLSRIVKPIYQEPSFSIKEKVAFGLLIFSYIPEKMRIDINIVDNPKAVSTNKKFLEEGLKGGYLPISWHEPFGLDESKHFAAMSRSSKDDIPRIMVRQGSPYGRYLSTLNPDGSFPTVDQLSIPYAENLYARHKYIINKDTYIEVIDILKDPSVTPEEKARKLRRTAAVHCAMIDEKYVERQVEWLKVFQESSDALLCRSLGVDTTYGVYGSVAPMYIDDDPNKERIYGGGAFQLTTPIQIIELVRLGALKEVE